MSDEPNQPIVEEEVVADQPQLAEPHTEPAVNEEPEQPELPETAEAPEEAPQEEDKEEVPEDRPPSNRLLTRSQQIIEKYGSPEVRRALSHNAPSQPEPALDYKTALDADPEVIQQLEADRQRTNQQQYNEGLRRAEAIEFKTNIRLDLPLVSEKLSKLDPRDAEALDKEYLYTVGFDPSTGYVQNPNIGYAEFIEARIDQAERLASAMNAQTVKNVAKQAAATGLRPDGSSAKRLNLNQAPQAMSLDELYAASGIPDSRPKK